MSHPVAARASMATPLVISVGSLLLMLLIDYLLRSGAIPLLVISQYELVNLTFSMQMAALALSFVAIALMWVYNRESFKIYFRPGDTSPEKNDWKFYGPALAISFTIGTTFLMAFSVTSQHGSINESFFSLLPLVLLISATNAWSEEIFTRFVIVAGLHGKLQPMTICWISAAIFGLAHISGTPSGLFGVIMSGLLGFFLARSVIETRGLGWALFIHFLQDVVIFGAGAMIIAGKA